MSKSPSKKRPSSATGLKWFISASATVATLIGWQAFAAQEPVSVVAQQPQPQPIQVPATQPVPVAQQPQAVSKASPPSSLHKQRKAKTPAVRSTPRHRPAPVTTTRSSR
ncbi:MAG: hypothetical protein WCA07_09745 [Gloeobacterales cyanobacterium]